MQMTLQARATPPLLRSRKEARKIGVMVLTDADLPDAHLRRNGDQTQRLEACLERC